MGDDKKPRETEKISLPTQTMNPHLVGNSLFNRAVFAIGFDGSLTRNELAALLGAKGILPRDVTVEDLDRLLPEIEKRLRLLVPQAEAEKSLDRLRKMLQSWEEV
jgi:hypothetical protein